jgi:hypothetical protein
VLLLDAPLANLDPVARTEVTGSFRLRLCRGSYKVAVQCPHPGL